MNIISKKTSWLAVITTMCLFAVAFFAINSCTEPENLPETDTMFKIDFSNIEDLYAQPLSVIQECVQGKWIKKGTYGGYAGWIPIPDSVLVEITGNELNEMEFQWVKHTKQDWNWQTSFDTYAIQYAGYDEPSIYFHNIRNDSLNVEYAPNRSCYDCFTGELWIRTK